MDDATDIEKALARAARAFVSKAVRDKAEAEANLELLGVLLRLGYRRSDVAMLEQPDGRLPHALAAAASRLLESRIAQLSRRARSGGPGYDVGRHILFHRARKRIMAMEPGLRDAPAGAQSGEAEGQTAMLPKRLSIVRRPTRPRSKSQLSLSHSPNSPTRMQI